MDFNNPKVTSKIDRNIAANTVEKLLQAIAEFDTRTRDFEVGKRYSWGSDKQTFKCVLVGKHQGVFQVENHPDENERDKLSIVHRDHLRSGAFLPCD